MNFTETVKNVGIALGGLLVMAALFCLAMIFIVGATALSEWVAPWFPVVFWSSLLVAFFIARSPSFRDPGRPSLFAVARKQGECDNTSS